MATIVIKLRNTTDSPEVEAMYATHAQKYTFDKVSRAAYHMWGRKASQYCLLINGREYAWPHFPKNILEERMVRIDILEKHLTDCIEIDEAFYG